MTLLRSIAVLFVLLAQVMPAQVMPGGMTTVKCTMGCCAGLEEAEMASCGCPDSPLSSEPANAPPGSRERAPQLVWAAVDADQPAIRSPKAADDEGKPRLVERDRDKVAHVRLPVLFCSLLN
jgi:hypothetical protein